MALLTIEKRKRYFEKLGLGEYNEANIKALQKKYLRKKDVDGLYGIDTDRLLRHVYNCSLVKGFEPEEFKCECGGKYCTGYPSYMKQAELKHLQRIRDFYGKPITVTCGLRDKTYNSKLRGSIKNSLHLVGRAADIYIPGVTDTLAGRKAAIKVIKTFPNHNYTYGNGYNSNGVAISAGYMGNCIHTDTKKVVSKITKKVTQYLTQAELDKWFAALKKQYNNAKNSVYAWIEGPTYANSRKKSTCIAEHSVALQLLGLLNEGGYFYFHPTKKKISGNAASYVKKHPELFKFWYPNKYLRSLIKSGKLQPGDMVFFGDPGYHSMTYAGLNSKGKPLFITLGHKKGYKVTYTYYANRKVNMIVRLKKVSK
jgi:hypothetical protein